jgi:hypothetical protein
MLCEKVVEQFSAYLDGQLTASEREAVRSHIAACARCRGELEALDRAVYAVADLPRLRAPSDLRDQVMAKLDRVAPAEVRQPRWRMYWGAAAAVALAVVIMLLTTLVAPRRTAPEAVAPAGKNVPGGEVVLANRDGFAGSKRADEKFLRKVANPEPSGGTAYSVGAPAFEPQEVKAPMSRGQIALITHVPSEQIGRRTQVSPVLREQIVLPSANPRAAYFNAVGVAAKGGWLPAEQQKSASDSVSLKSSEAEQSAYQGQVLQLMFRIKQSQVPLLKNALAAAGLQAAEEKGGLGGEAQPTYQRASRLAFAPARRNLEVAANAARTETRFGLEDHSATANTATAAAYAPAPAVMKAPEGVVGAEAAGPQQPMAQKEAQATEATTLSQTRKAEAAEEPVVQVTLLFPLAESAVPAAPPAAGATNSATPE